ncbi:hypothetical protein EAI_10365 [Harpegnathos saltator]|uniref:Uncharacterized protein n=1 Tax=Harpegnathos saltator TaxID=610380 RepID=E2B5Q6_HARSA|nr:hypothetical protein EAI_10365 [Harpegnathos saltator]
MIFYCGEEHKLIHENQHKEICEAIQALSKTRKLCDTHRMTKDEWIIHKKKNLEAFVSVLNRKIKPYEKFMFLFQKSCHVCHQQQNLRVACQGCYNVNICDNHMAINVKHDCTLMRISLLMDIYDLFQKRYAKIPQYYLPKNLFAIMSHNSTELIVQNYVACGIKEYIWGFDDYKYSDSISGPLTGNGISRYQNPNVEYL